jgi:hypothetical protein
MLVLSSSECTVVPLMLTRLRTVDNFGATRRGVDAWLDAAPIQSQEHVVDDWSVSLQVLAIAATSAATSGSPKTVVRESLDFIQLQRIILFESAPDNVRADACRLIKNLASGDGGYRSEKRRPAVTTGSQMWAAVGALLKCGGIYFRSFAH